MKGFLIFMVLLVGGCIYAFTHTHDLVQTAIERMKLEEGPDDQAAQDLQRSNPAAYLTKYQPFLQRRETISKWGSTFGETDLVLALGKETRERYEQTPLGSDPAYEDLLYRLAGIEEDLGHGPESYAIHRRYEELFPSGKHFTESTAAVQRLMTKYNTIR